RLGDPLDLANDGLTVEIFQLNLELATARRMFDAGVAADVALGLQHFEHAGAHFRARGRDLGLRTHLRVADAGDEIGDRIVRLHFDAPPSQSAFTSPGTRPLEPSSRSAMRESLFLR